MKNKQEGFTLIELVIVVAIISILAAIALPKYVAIQQQARYAKQQSMLGALRSGSVLAHSACILDGSSASSTCTPTGGYIVMENSTISMVNGYPAAGSILAATQIDTGMDNVEINVLASQLTLTVPGGTGCTVTYTEAISGGMPAVTFSPLSSC